MGRNSLKESREDVAASIGRAGQTLKQDFERTGHDAAAAVKDVGGAIGRSGERLTDDAQHAAEASRKKLGKVMMRRPMALIGAATAIGAVLGAALFRTRRPEADGRIDQ